MSITSSRWTDPQSGIAYATRARLPSAHMNNVLDGMRAFDRQFSWNGIRQWYDFGTNGINGVIEQTAAGKLIGIGATKYYTMPRATTSTLTVDAGTTHPGSITTTGPAGVAYSPTLRKAMFAYATKSYITGDSDTTFATGVSLPSSIATVGSLVWCVGSSKFIVCGRTVGSSAQFGYTSDGATWADSVGSPTSDAAWAGNGLLATDGANGVLAVPDAISASASVWYSANGGVNFTKYGMGFPTSNLLRGPCWDSYRSEWLVAQQPGEIYASADPTAASWTLVSTLPATFTLYSFTALPDGQWVAVGLGGFLVSSDGGTTWENLGLDAVGTLTKVTQVDGRISVWGAGDSLISGDVL